MFKHYLDFKDLPLIGRIEISEPFKFDGSTFEVKREKGRHSRDVMIANQDIELELQREHFELLDIEQVLPDGTIFNLASHGFDYLLNEINTRGWEMSVEYIINYNGTDFTTGEIDGLTYKVSDNEISFKVTQNTLHSYIKKNESVKIDAFSDKSISGLPIMPCTTTDIFLKAKPLFEQSKWGEKETTKLYNGTGFTHDLAIPISNPLINFGLQNSYAPFDVTWQGTDLGITQVRRFIYDNRLVTANNELLDVKVKLNKVWISGATSQGRIYLRYGTTFFDSNGNFISAGNTPTTYLENELNS